MSNYFVEHFPLIAMCAFIASNKAFKSWASDFIIDLVRELAIDYLAGLIKGLFKKKKE